MEAANGIYHAACSLHCVCREMAPTTNQGTGPCPASSFFVTFEIILNSAKLLQVPHGQAGHESLRTEENQPHQSLRLQVHQRARKVDKDGKAL